MEYFWFNNMPGKKFCQPFKTKKPLFLIPAVHFRLFKPVEILMMLDSISGITNLHH
jgi:hypothetical protein